MKILISSDGTHAHFYQRVAWANAFNSCGMQAMLWDCKNSSAFDAFDTFEPDLFLGQTYNLTEDVVKCIKERPWLKVGLRAGDWGDQTPEIDHNRFNILTCSQQEIHALKSLQQETGQVKFVHIHYAPEAISVTHNSFESIGIKPISLMMCADVLSYRQAIFDPTLSCDIGFVGGYWPYKAQVLDPYLMPLLEPFGQYKVKIFGNQPWKANQYCGLISDDKVKDVFVSSKICPNLSEPHAQEYGFDVNERIFKILYAGGFCISDNVIGYKTTFGEHVPLADDPEHFKELIDYYLDKPSERLKIAEAGRDHVKQNHTGFHRAAQILSAFGNEDLSKEVVKQYKENMNVF